MQHNLTFIFFTLLLLLFAPGVVSPETHDSRRSSGHGNGDEQSRASKGADRNNPRALRDPPPPPLNGNNSVLGPPDVYLRVPELSVKHIGLEVDKLKADVSLRASVAGLVKVQAGVSVGVDKVNISIDDVGARLDLLIRLGSLVEIVNRTMQTLDLNPKLTAVINQVGDIATDTVGAAGGLVGSILGKTKGGGEITVDDKGNILEETKGSDGKVDRTVIGDYKKDMVFTGEQKDLGRGHVEKTYEYKKVGALVNIVFNSGGGVVRTTVVKADVQAGQDGKEGAGTG